MITLPNDLDRIVLLKDGALRNLLITQRYHDLSLALRDVIGKGDVVGKGNVNWSTFATWASKTAGQSIRNEEVPAFVRALATATPETAHHTATFDSLLAPFDLEVESLLLTPVASTLRDVSTSIAEGNLAVFAELAPEFVRFVKAFEGDASPDDAKLATYTKAFRPGPPESDGQELLASAFSAYYRAIFEKDAAMKARLFLFANCQVGIHEQTRLQPKIAAALDAPVTDVLEGYLRDAMANGAPTGVVHLLLAAVDHALSPMILAIERVWQQLATRFLMRLALPFGAEISLGEDIPLDRESGGDAFLPPELREVLTPEELVKLLLRFDRARGSSDLGSASRDWAVLEDRMNFIVNLFRSRQTDVALFGPPFTTAQTAAIESGKFPDGPL
jgi:hypothetical protein